MASKLKVNYGFYRTVSESKYNENLERNLNDWGHILELFKGIPNPLKGTIQVR